MKHRSSKGESPQNNDEPKVLVLLTVDVVAIFTHVNHLQSGSNEWLYLFWQCFKFFFGTLIFLDQVNCNDFVHFLVFVVILLLYQLLLLNLRWIIVYFIFRLRLILLISFFKWLKRLSNDYNEHNGAYNNTTKHCILPAIVEVPNIQSYNILLSVQILTLYKVPDCFDSSCNHDSVVWIAQSILHLAT